MKKAVLTICMVAVVSAISAQVQSAVPASEKPKSELKYDLSGDGSKYVKLTFLNQVWVRQTTANPGTTVNGQPTDNMLDIGLRRTRMQLYGQLNDHVFFYMQYGMNNFNFLSQNAGNRKLQAFFHDALGEYKVFKKNNALKLGGGLTIVNGLSRFSQPGVGTIMTTDVPVFLQATVDQTDEFSRKLSIYARGQVGKFDYRIALTDPFPVQTNGLTPPVLGKVASFTTYGHSKQYQGMFIYNFVDREQHTTPYMTGTYLGDKKVVNLEAGAIYQQNATWRTTTGADTVYDNMLMWSIAAYVDMPIKSNKYAISAYAGYFSTDYGQGYIRSNGIMNPANGSTNPAIFSGGGSSYPMFGTGNSIYAQAGFRLPNDLFKDNGTLMPYVSYRTSQYDRLKDPVQVIDAGLNWLMNKHSSKVSLNYQSRPVYTVQSNGDVTHTSNASSVWLQYQVAI